MQPIKTDRFLCTQCPDYNLCLYCYCRNPHKHTFQVLGPLGVHVLHESSTPERVSRDSIVKKEFFFKNLGDKLEITVYPYKQPVPL